MKKHCDTCDYSYYAKDKGKIPFLCKLRQHCSNPNYNSPDYSHEMFLEDRAEDHCRYWTPRKERKAS